MNNEQQVASYGTEAIAKESKQNWVKIFSVWTGLIFSVSTMLYGGVVGSQLPLGQAFIAIGCANLFLAILTTFISHIGVETGLGAFELTKYGFGNFGGKIISLLRTIEVFTLDSISCAACTYMWATACTAKEEFGDKIDILEHKYATREGIAQCRTMKVNNLPSLYINGELKYASIIPEQGEFFEEIGKMI